MSYDSICAEVCGANEGVGKIESSVLKVKVAGRMQDRNDKEKQAAKHTD